VSTNAQGIFSVVIGDTGTTTNIGSYANVNWKLSSKFLKVEMDPAGGSNFISMGTTPLQYVPFSYYSNGVDAVNVNGILPIKSGGTGVASISDMKIALALDKVNNTADLDKPISTPTQTALDTKLNKADTASLSNRINSKFTKTDILPVENGGTGVNDLSKLKAALKLDTTSLSLPNVTSTNAINITGSGADISGNIVSDGGSTILNSGICFDTLSNPSTSISQVLFSSPSNVGSYYLTGTFQVFLSGICKPNTNYYYRTFAINKNGTAYSEVKSFTTKPAFNFINEPVITFNASVPIITFSLRANGDTLNGYRVEARKSDGNGANNYISTINAIRDTTISYILPDNLTPNTNYNLIISLDSKRASVQSNTISFTSPVPTVPTVSFVGVPSVSTTNASLVFIINNNGGASIINSGFCWSTSTNPDISLPTKVTLQFSSVGFNYSYGGFGPLNPATTYYLRAYATNSIGTGYGPVISITTLPQIPILSSPYISSITNNSATAVTNIQNSGTATITSSGVVWSTTSQTPTLPSTFKTIDGTSSGSFTSTITGLNPSTTYYIRGYATSSVGTGYSSGFNSFTTLANVPILSGTISPTLTGSIALSGGTISSTNGSNIIERGVIFDVNSNPTYQNSYHVTSNLDNNLTFQCLTSYLSSGSTYYFRSYAINANGIGYGPIIQLFIPYPPSPPVINSVNYANLLSSSVVLSTNVYTPDYSQLTDKGFIWSTSSTNISTSLSTKQSFGSGIGYFSGTISNLIPNTTYYIKAYATNVTGTSYSNYIQITTPN
jgi:hypothetical protein